MELTGCLQQPGDRKRDGGGRGGPQGTENVGRSSNAHGRSSEVDFGHVRNLDSDWSREDFFGDGQSEVMPPKSWSREMSGGSGELVFNTPPPPIIGRQREEHSWNDVVVDENNVRLVVRYSVFS